MTFDPGKPVQTRDGRKARIICDDMRNHASIAAVICDGSLDYIFTYYPTGKLHGRAGTDSSHDLINIPEKRWATLHANGIWYEHKSAEDAAKDRDSNDVACIEFTEGEGL